MALQLYKGKLVGAKKGYELLKKKSDALKVGNSLGSLLALSAVIRQARTGLAGAPALVALAALYGILQCASAVKAIRCSWKLLRLR